MKIQLSARKKGFILAITFALIVVVALTLPSYLSLVTTQYRAVATSFTWYNSVPMAEAGVEEAMAHLNFNAVVLGTGFVCDGWTETNMMGTNSVHAITKTRWIGDSYYTAYILTNAGAGGTPEIVAVGGSIARFMGAAPSSERYAQGILQQRPIFAQASAEPDYGSWTPSLTVGQDVAAPPASGPYVRRQIKVTTRLQHMITKGLVAKGVIDMKGNHVATDSYDSADPAHSGVNGVYDPDRAKDNGDVATNGDVIDVGNADIKGHISTGKGGQVNVGSQGSVGDESWVSAGSHGIQPTHSSDDMNVKFPEVKAPFATGSPPTCSGSCTVVHPVISETTGAQTYAYPTYPPSGTGSVTTNTSVTSSTTYPTSGTYLGTVSTNTTPTTSASLPASGTYIGVVTTNRANVTSSIYPAVGTYEGTITTNHSTKTTVSAPAAGTYIGLITTNTSSVTSSNYPAGAAGTVTTNTTSTTSSTLPSSGTYIGLITTNVSNSSTNLPAAGTYTGNITTNYGSTNTSASQTYPSGNVVVTSTNSILTNSPNNVTNFPSFVDTSKAVITNYNNGQGQGGNGVKNYTYYRINNYTYKTISSYSYTGIPSYVYNKIVSYTAPAITGYTYDGIDNYTYTSLTGYSYNAISGYSYSAISGYTASSVLTTTTNYSTNTYDMVFDTGNFLVTDISGSVLVTGRAVVYVPAGGSLDIGNLTIDPGASLNLYSDVTSVSLSGNDAANNDGKPGSFYYWGMPHNTDISLHGNATFTGVIYAPDASFTLGGGGHDTMDFIGAATVHDVKMNGHMNFHFDEDLLKTSPPAEYVIGSWVEQTVTIAP